VRHPVPLSQTMRQQHGQHQTHPPGGAVSAGPPTGPPEQGGGSFQERARVPKPPAPAATRAWECGAAAFRPQPGAPRAAGTGCPRRPRSAFARRPG
jgi:hypothetical protein